MAHSRRSSNFALRGAHIYDRKMENTVHPVQSHTPMEPAPPHSPPAGSFFFFLSPSICRTSFQNPSGFVLSASS